MSGTGNEELWAMEDPSALRTDLDRTLISDRGKDKCITVLRWSWSRHIIISFHCRVLSYQEWLVTSFSVLC